MKTFRLWHLVAVGVVLSLLTTQVRGEDKKQMERKAKAALALAAAKGPPGFVNLAPLPREVPKDMPKKACVCGDDCKCKKGDCPAKCPVEPVVAPKKDAKPKADPAQPAPVGYQWQKWPGEDWKLVPVAVTAGQPYCPPGQS